MFDDVEFTPAPVATTVAPKFRGLTKEDEIRISRISHRLSGAGQATIKFPEDRREYYLSPYFKQTEEGEYVGMLVVEVREISRGHAMGHMLTGGRGWRKLWDIPQRKLRKLLYSLVLCTERERMEALSSREMEEVMEVEF